MTEEQIADMVKMYCDALKEGRQKVDTARPLSTQKDWVRFYAQGVVPDVVPFITAYMIWTKEGRGMKENVNPEILIGQKLVVESRKLQLWGRKKRVTSKKGMKAEKSYSLIQRYHQLLQEFEYIPEDDFIAKLIGVPQSSLVLERVSLRNLRFIPNEHGFKVEKSRSELNPDFVASVVVKVLRDMGV